MKSVLNEKLVFPQMIKLCQKNFMFLKKKSIFGRFCDFGKNHKNGQKLTFSFERWKFFQHTFIIWENSTFSFFILFYLLKKNQKRHFFHFFWQKIAPPSTLRAKKSVEYQFSWNVYKIEIVTFDLIKNWYFIKFWPYMSIWGTFLLLKAKK